MNDTEFKLNRNCSNFAVKPGAEKEKILKYYCQNWIGIFAFYALVLWQSPGV